MDTCIGYGDKGNALVRFSVVNIPFSDERIVIFDEPC
jgi:hypothetical protein